MYLVVMQSGVFKEDSDNETRELVLQSGPVFLGDARRKTLQASVHVHHHLSVLRIVHLTFSRVYHLLYLPT